MYIFLAVSIALVHAAYILFFFWTVFTSLAGRLHFYPWARTLLWIWIVGKTLSYVIFENCVLTMLERYLRERGGDLNYAQGFIEHYSSQAGIFLSDTVIAWLVITPVVLVILSEAYWRNRRVYYQV